MNLEINVGGLNANVGDLEADLASAKEVVTAAGTAAQEDLEWRVRAQGGVFRAVVERVHFTVSFSVVGGRLARVAGSQIADVIFKRVQKAVPDVDRSLLGYAPLSDKMFRQAYARTLLDALTTSRVLRELDSRTVLLSAEQIAELSTDRDVDLDPVLRRLKAGEVFSSDTEEEGGDEEEDEEEQGLGEEGSTSDVGANSPPY